MNYLQLITARKSMKRRHLSPGNGGGGYPRLVQIQIQQQHVHPRLTKKSKLPPLSVLNDKLSDGVLGQMPLTRHSSHLELSGSRGDIRIKPRSRSSHQIDRNIDARMIDLQRRHIPCNPVNQLLVRRRIVRRARVRRIISIPRRRWPRMKVLRSRKRLTDNPRTDQLTVLIEQLPVRLIVKEHLRKAGNHERIDQPKNNRSDKGVKHR